MSHLETQTIFCPYCSSPIELVIDCSVEYQQYVEDCEVCCHPIKLRVNVGPDFEIDIDASGENQ